MKNSASETYSLHLREATRFVKSQLRIKPTIALILGSGLGDFAETLEIHHQLLSSEIPHYPSSTVQGHAGKLVFGHISYKKLISSPLLAFQGRIHYYESGTIDPVVFPVLLAHSLGARTLIVTNAAGGVNSSFYPGDLMLIKDIISLTFLSSIRSMQPGKHQYFDTKLQNKLRNVAAANSIKLQEGTYCWLKGPTYETAAEIRMLKMLGVDAVGMSTVPEILTAKKLGMNILGISLISNLATGISSQKLSHQEVTETANRIKKTFTGLMKDLVLSL